MNYSVAQIAAMVQGKVLGSSAARITGLSGIREAKKGHLTFLSQKKYLSFLSETKATAVLVDSSISCETKKTLILVKNPSLAFDHILLQCFPEEKKVSKSTISDQAFIGHGVKLGKNVQIQPFAVIGDGVQIGDRTCVESGVYLGKEVTVGADSHLHPNVTVLPRVQIGSRVVIHSGTVLGSDGFGFEPVPGKLPKKIAQRGTVVIEDDVEIGSNVSIDRARFEKTLIGRGTKIDNLVHIAHNVEIGKGCLILGQVGIAGSAVLGNDVIVAGQAGILGHLTVGNQTTIASRSVVTKDLPSNVVVSGFPAQNHQKMKRLVASMAFLPTLVKTVSKLKKQLESLKKS
jgi:UDP-3-O-[3-hydroxymyristoyl] glucosamine N-acyltransferase